METGAQGFLSQSSVGEFTARGTREDDGGDRAVAASVGEVAAQIRGYRKPEPYKGKGIRYQGEHVAHKEGKTAVSGG